MVLLPHACPLFLNPTMAAIIAYKFVCDYQGKGYIFHEHAYWDYSLTTWEEWIKSGECEEYKNLIFKNYS